MDFLFFILISLAFMALENLTFQSNKFFFTIIIIYLFDYVWEIYFHQGKIDFFFCFYLFLSSINC